MRTLLISTYEMGRQPFGLASPAAWLKREGLDVRCVDASRDQVDDADFAASALIAFHLPMHTATRLAAPLIRRARQANPGARICAYGLYAPLNAEWLRSIGVDAVLGGEFEEELVGLAAGRTAPPAAAPGIPRIRFLTPDRSGLPPLARYATLQTGSVRRIVGYTEASRGCRHLCRHCPIVPVYQGQFRVVPPDVVIADVSSQVAAGAQHITFGDPDFFNSATHAMRVVEMVHAAHPDVTYDVTIKIEHLLRQRHLLPRLRETGCLFVTSAVESLDDAVLRLLDKGHTRAGFLEAVAMCAAAGVTLVPTFVAFHPWLTIDGYCELLDTIEAHGLIGHMAPVQLAIRLLIPQGSRLLELADVRSLVQGFDATTLTYRWSHRDPEVDRLQHDVFALIGGRLTSDRFSVFEGVTALAHARAGTPRPQERPMRDRATVPYLNEPWYC